MKGDTHVSNYCLFNSQALTAFTSSLYIAGVLASLIASGSRQITDGEHRCSSEVSCFCPDR
ncbi:Hexose carrier protein HEX6 [Platanthera guangdongensis]|uniref:Hexose carrier protein HEX6 n=1 Tax=Platanthera guangdongensis TaxID=2320717 RepID=A0ABR2MJA0_9ASPA